MNKRQIKQAQARITEIYEELSPLIDGTGANDLIEELIDLEISLTELDNR